MDTRRPSLFDRLLRLVTSGLDRILRLVTDVRPGEGATAVLLALNIFLVLAAYYVIKPVREALLGEGVGTSGKAYMYAAIVILLAAVVPLYGRVANRMPRRRLIGIVIVLSLPMKRDPNAASVLPLLTAIYKPGISSGSCCPSPSRRTIIS